MHSKIVEFENRLITHQKYTFSRYNQLKTVIVYLKIYFDNGGTLTDRQTQLDMIMELENELECLESFRYSENKDEDFALRVNTTLRIVGIMKKYIPATVSNKLPANNSIWGNFKERLFPKYNYSPFELIYNATMSWAH